LLGNRNRAAGAGAIGLLVASYFCSPLVYQGYALPALWTAGPTYVEVMNAAYPERVGSEHLVHPTFFGAPWPLVIQSLIYQLPVLAFLLLAAVRRMSSERAQPYSKPAAVLLLIVLSVLAMGGLFGHADVTPAGAMPLVLCVMLVGAGVASLAVTPDWLAYSAGMRRAARGGVTRPGPWSDDASNKIVVTVMAAVTALAGALVAGLVRGDTDEISWDSVAVAAAAVLAFGFALQWFALAHRRRAISYLMLFLFLWGAMPLVVGTMLSAAHTGDFAAHVTSLCPISGIIHPTALAVIGNAGLAVVFGALLWLKERAIRQRLDGPQDAAAAPDG